jgi:hypothetical protein
MTYAVEMLQHKAVELTVLDQMLDTNEFSPPGGTYCLPRMPVLSPMSTCYRPRPPRLRGLLKEAPEILCCRLLYHTRIPFRLPFFAKGMRTGPIKSAKAP